MIIALLMKVLQMTDFGEEWHKVQSSNLKDTMLKCCETRLETNQDEDWAVTVKARISNCIDLVEVEAKYHQNCRVRFSTMKNLNAEQVGRPKDNDKKTAFELACIWLKNEPSIRTVSQFAEKMKEFSSSKESYVNRYIKKLLIEKYGASVIIKPMGTGKEDLITFEETAKGIMEDQFKDNIDRETTTSRYNENPNDANNRMVDKVGQLIQEDISKLSQGNTYPSPQDLNNVENLHSWLPESLERLLKILIPDDLKRTAIGHTILSASRRNFHSPLLFGLGVQLDHSFGSKWLNTHLSCLGFSVTYSQVRQYKKAVMESESLTPVIPPGSFVQWSTDNVDHNCRTLDGKNTFHGMGIVASVTPNLSQ